MVLIDSTHWSLLTISCLKQGRSSLPRQTLPPDKEERRGGRGTGDEGGKGERMEKGVKGVRSRREEVES